jgi:hypothetical protein
MGVEEGLVCWNCGRTTGVTGGVVRSDQCPHCLADLRSCRGCRHFDPTRKFQCRENIDHGVGNKEKANFCDFFQVREVFKTAGGLRTRADDKESRKAKFDDLFED